MRLYSMRAVPHITHQKNLSLGCIVCAVCTMWIRACDIFLPANFLEVLPHSRTRASTRTLDFLRTSFDDMKTSTQDFKFCRQMSKSDRSCQRTARCMAHKVLLDSSIHLTDTSKNQTLKISSGGHDRFLPPACLSNCCTSLEWLHACMYASNMQDQHA